MAITVVGCKGAGNKQLEARDMGCGSLSFSLQKTSAGLENDFRYFLCKLLGSKSLAEGFFSHTHRTQLRGCLFGGFLLSTGIDQWNLLAPGPNQANPTTCGAYHGGAEVPMAMLEEDIQDFLIISKIGGHSKSFTSLKSFTRLYCLCQILTALVSLQLFIVLPSGNLT